MWAVIARLGLKQANEPPFVQFHMPGKGTWKYALSVGNFRAYTAEAIELVNRKKVSVLVYDARSAKAVAVVVWGSGAGSIIRSKPTPGVSLKKKLTT